MEAIDPNYYKNLLQITTLPLEDLGLDLTFSADTEMFGKFVQLACTCSFCYVLSPCLCHDSFVVFCGVLEKITPVSVNG